ncbi:hypothetical protein [Metabacillus litoralis]|uniref:hypothetical protein n=1 Tax=Metabacillus litoralis TaxID=152268 RepID=UPI001CFF2A6E|nr:hypothetical protein [Metabacillus litoralis]
MDKQMIVTMIILIVLIESFIVFLFIKYKQGKIDHNPLITILIKESKILYYAFFQWRTKKKVDSDSTIFSLHKNSGYFWLFIALLHEQVIEMIVLHIFLKKEDPTFAYIILGLHVYSIFYMMGDYNWVRNTPIRIKNNIVEMKIGARKELTFHVNQIKNIQKAELTYNKSGGIVHPKDVFHVTALPRVLTRIFGISDDLRYEIVFKTPVVSKGYFGLKKDITKAFLYIDQSDELVTLLKGDCHAPVFLVSQN